MLRSGYLHDQMTGWNTRPGVRHLVQALEPPSWHWGHPGCQEGLCCHHPGGHLLATHNRKGPSAAAALLGNFLVPSSQAPRLDGISKPGASGRSLGHYSGPLLQFWLFRQRSRSLPNPGTARERSEPDPKSGQPPRVTHPYTGHTVTRPMLILSRFKTQTTSIPVGPGVQHTVCRVPASSASSLRL